MNSRGSIPGTYKNFSLRHDILIECAVRSPSYRTITWPQWQADHKQSYSAEVKECMALYLHCPLRFHGVVPKHSDKFAFGNTQSIWWISLYLFFTDIVTNNSSPTRNHNVDSAHENCVLQCSSLADLRFKHRIPDAHPHEDCAALPAGERDNNYLAYLGNRIICNSTFVT